MLESVNIVVSWNHQKIETGFRMKPKFKPVFVEQLWENCKAEKQQRHTNDLCLRFRCQLQPFSQVGSAGFVQQDAAGEILDASPKSE